MALYNDSKYLDLIPITFWELSQLESVVHFFLEEALLTEALYEKMLKDVYKRQGLQVPLDVLAHLGVSPMVYR